MESINKGYITLKGFAIAISMGLLVYIVLNGVRLAERFVEVKEQEVKAIEYCERFDLGGPNRIILIDKKEKAAYRLDTKTGEYVKLKE